MNYKLLDILRTEQGHWERVKQKELSAVSVAGVDNFTTITLEFIDGEINRVIKKQINLYGGNKETI